MGIAGQIRDGGGANGMETVDNRSMSTTTHVPRVAWDAARAIVNATSDPARAAWFANWLNTNAGPQYGQLLIESHNRLASGRGFESMAVEAGVWRVRLDDLLHSRPELVEPLAKLVRMTAGGAP
jgi:hypothetical protein